MRKKYYVCKELVNVITTKLFMHMKKISLLLIVLFVSTYGFCQTTARSYKAPVKSYQTSAKPSQSSTVKPQTPVVTSPVSANTAPTPVVATQAPAVTSPTPVAASPVSAVVAQNPVAQLQSPANSRQTSVTSPQVQPVAYRTVYDADQTTLEEYDYVTKELKIQIDGNFDMRKGYELKTIKVVNNNRKRIELGQLIRIEDKSIACYWIKFTNFKTMYFCLPNPHSTTSIINKCNQDLILGMNNESLSMSIISLLSGLQWKVN